MREGEARRKRTRHNSGKQFQNGKIGGRGLVPRRQDGQDFLQALPNLAEIGG